MRLVMGLLSIFCASVTAKGFCLLSNFFRKKGNTTWTATVPAISIVSLIRPQLGGRCPKCGKDLVRGVLGRIDKLADRPMSAEYPLAVPYKRIVPLEEVIGEALGKGRASKAVFEIYKKLLAGVGPEFAVLLDAAESAIASASSVRVAEAVARMRAGQLVIRPGYDGVFGEVHIFGADERPKQGHLS